MPDPREIERLKKTVRALADEDEVLNARGEVYAELPPPPELSAFRDANQVKQSVERESENVTEHFTDLPSPSEPEAEEAGDAVPDFSSLLQDMDFSMPEQEDSPAQEPDDLPETTGMAPPAEEAASPLDDFDLGAFVEPFSQDEAPSSGDKSEEPAGEPAPGAGELGAEAGGIGADATGAEAGAFSEDAGGFGDIEAPSPGEFSLEDFAGGTGLAQEEPAAEAAPMEAPSTEVFAPGQDLSSGEFSLEEPVLEMPSGAESLSPGDFSLDEAGTPAPQEELFADEGLSQAELAQTAHAEEGEGDGQGAAEIGTAPSGGAFDIPSFDVGDMGGSALEGDAAPMMDLGGDASLEEEAPGPGFDAGIQARADFGAPAAGGEDKLGAPKAEEDPFASFNFDDGGLLGGSMPSLDSIDSGLASLDQGMKGADSFSGPSELGGAAGQADFLSPGSFGAKKEGSGAAAAEEISLTEKEVDRLQDSLLSYPLNLRLEIEQCIANDVLPPDQTAQLVKALVDGKNAPDTAALLGRFLGKRIPVPKGFEKRTGEQFEAERGTFWYAFKTNILPLIGISAAVIAVLAMLVFLGYNLVWKPLYADSIYRTGYKLIPEGDYKQSESLFDAAVKVKRVRGWYFRYAESYAAHRQYALAEKKYEEILRYYKKDKKAAIDYARFEFQTLLAYEKAESLLKSTLLDWYPNDPDGLLLLGDDYLAWAEDSADAALRAEKLEGARKQFAALIRLYGRKDLYLGRMLVYFIRTDKMKEVAPLATYFLSKGKPVIDSAIYAELGGYLIDAEKLEQVRTILFLGVKKDPLLPDNHYQLARYYRAMSNAEEEAKALKRAVAGYEALPSLSRKRLMAYIDSLKWSGDGAYRAKEYIDAENFYQKAIKNYEDALATKRIEASGRFGEIYAARADIYYYDRAQYETAFQLYQDAERNLYSTPETAYKRGYVRYRGGEYKEALAFFYQASQDFTVSDNLLLSLADALYYREDYSAASGYYLQLSQAMRDEIDRIQFQDPQNRPDQSRMVRLLMVSTNNLGVALYQLGNRGGDASRRSAAMAYFTESLHLYDVMNRDQTTMVRAEGANLAFLNLDGILHPTRLFVPQIYPDISRDLVDSDEKIAQDAKLYAGKAQ